MIRILVCDDHPVVREGLVMMLGTQPDMEVVGEAGDGLEAGERAAALNPGGGLMDPEMARPHGAAASRRGHEGKPHAGLLGVTPSDNDEAVLPEVVGGAGDGREAVDGAAALNPAVLLMARKRPRLDGPAAIRRIHEANPDARILVLTAYDTDERILQAVQAGARGYLLKGVPRDEIFQAVRLVHSGGPPLPPARATKLLNRVGDLLRGEREETLTEREMQVLELMAKGYRNKEIAKELFITERTVKFHANILFQKLNVESRTEAVSQAIQRGIIKL